MTTTNTWLVENAIILSKIDGAYTGSDLRQNSIEIPAMVADLSGSVHILFDATSMASIRFTPREATHILKYMQDGHFDRIAICGIKKPLRPFSTVLANVLVAVLGIKMTFFETQAEAIAWLQSESTPELS